MSQTKLVIEEVLPHLYRVEVPLPDSPLKSINSYIIKSGDRSLVIDTGMNRKICLNTMNEALKQLNLDTGKTDFFITHSHADHMGLVTTLASKDSKIYFGHIEAEWLRAESLVQWAVNSTTFAHAYGFPDDVAGEMVQNISRMKDKMTIDPDPIGLNDGDTLNIGDYSFKCIETPGHSRGHMCLYEAKQQVLVSGDHVLDDITPNISSRYNEENPLAEYLASLDKIYPLEVRLVLPGHRKLLTDLKGRINELKHHHEMRANEVLHILESGSLNAFQVASRMTWDMSYETVEEFPVFTKWFAFSEALSHLKYLESLGKIRRIYITADRIVYTLS